MEPEGPPCTGLSIVHPRAPHHQAKVALETNKITMCAPNNRRADGNEYTGPPTRCRRIAATGKRCRIGDGRECRGLVKMEHYTANNAGSSVYSSVWCGWQWELHM